MQKYIAVKIMWYIHYTTDFKKFKIFSLTRENILNNGCFFRWYVVKLKWLNM